MTASHVYALFSAAEMKIKLTLDWARSTCAIMNNQWHRPCSAELLPSQAVWKDSPKMVFLENCHLNFCSLLTVLISGVWKQFERLWITAKLLPIIFQCLLKCFPECSALSLHRETLCYTTFCSMQCRQLLYLD